MNRLNQPEKWKNFRAIEYARLREALSLLRGYYLGVLTEDEIHLESGVQNCFSISQYSRSGMLRAQWDQLPFLPESMDALVFLHALEQVESPDDLLLEAHRVLRPDGRLLIVGFHCARWASCQMGYARYGKRFQGCHGFPWRLKSLLNEHGFRVLRRERYGGCWRSKARGWPLSVGYLWEVEKSEPALVVEPKKVWELSSLTPEAAPCVRMEKNI